MTRPILRSEELTRLAADTAAALLTTPSANVPQAGRDGLSVGERAAVAVVVDASTAANTKAAYRSDWARFTRWTTSHGHLALPADPLVVAAYVTQAAAEQKGPGRFSYAPTSLTRWVSSINQVHTAAGHPAPGRSEVVRRALSGIRRIRATPPRRRAPLVLADIKTLLQPIRGEFDGWPGGVAARRDSALLLIGFAGAHRRSELTALRLDDVAVHPTDGLHLTMRTSKTDQEARGTIRAIPYGRDAATCPPCAYLRWRLLLRAWGHAGRAGAIAEIRRQTRQAHHTPGSDAVAGAGLVDGHLCRVPHQLEPAQRPGAEPGDGGSVTEGPGQGSGWLFPTVHKTGAIHESRAMSGDAVNAMIARRAAAAGYSPAHVATLGGHSLRAGFVTEAFRQGADAHAIMRQTGHRNPAILETYRREHAPLVGNAVTRLGL